MGMDVETSNAFDSLEKEILTKLMDEFSNLAVKKPEERVPTDTCDSLINHAIELLTQCREWSRTQAEANTGSDEMSDEEAQMLLADMDGKTEEKTEDSASGEMSDDEAQMLLADMDGKTEEKTEDSASGEMSDEEAQMLLADMDGKTEEKTEDSASDEMSDDEASQMLAEMDKPSEKNVQTSEEPVEDSTEEDSEFVEENVEEVEEVGESDFGSDPDMIKDFMSNADELMETLDDQILNLEQDPSNKEIIEEIFRAAHTLKGAAGMFAFNAIERVMHRMENFFDQVRKGKLTADSDSIDVILKSVDIIHSLLEGVRQGKETGIKTAPIVRALNQVCSGKYTKDPSLEQTEKPKETNNEQKQDVEQKSKSDEKKSAAKKSEQSTIRVDLQRLDALVNLVGELVIDRTRFAAIEEELRTIAPHEQFATNMSETVQLFGRHMNEIQDIIMKVRMVPIGNAFNKFPRVIRDMAKQLQKDIDLNIEGGQTELDKTLVEQIGDPLVHLIRNAVDHGIEMPEDRIKKGKDPKGKVALSARQEGNQIIINVEDDGKGMDAEAIRQKGIERGLIKEDDKLDDRDIFGLIFEAGFSTAAQVTNISGRGVGMDVVKRQISKLKGIIDIKSQKDHGSKLEIQLPLTLAIVQSLLVQTQNEIFAIPLSSVVESIRIKPEDIQKVGESEVIKRRNMVLPLLYLQDVLDLDKKRERFWYGIETNSENENRRKNMERLFVVVVGNAERRFGIVVDTLLNQQEMVIKSMGTVLKDVACVAGGAILGNGDVVLVLDIAELENHFRSKTRSIGIKSEAI